MTAIGDKNSKSYFCKYRNFYSIQDSLIFLHDNNKFIITFTFAVCERWLLGDEFAKRMLHIEKTIIQKYRGQIKKKVKSFSIRTPLARFKIYQMSAFRWHFFYTYAVLKGIVEGDILSLQLIYEEIIHRVWMISPWRRILMSWKKKNHSRRGPRILLAS